MKFVRRSFFNKLYQAKRIGKRIKKQWQGKPFSGIGKDKRPSKYFKLIAMRIAHSYRRNDILGRKTKIYLILKYGKLRSTSMLMRRIKK